MRPGFGRFHSKPQLTRLNKLGAEQAPSFVNCGAWVSAFSLLSGAKDKMGAKPVGSASAFPSGTGFFRIGSAGSRGGGAHAAFTAAANARRLVSRCLFGHCVFIPCARLPRKLHEITSSFLPRARLRRARGSFISPLENCSGLFQRGRLGAVR